MRLLLNIFNAKISSLLSLLLCLKSSSLDALDIALAVTTIPNEPQAIDSNIS